MAKILAVVLVAQTALSAFLLEKINEIQPDPYIDEIFHVPQTGNYCVYNFSHWDSKITTLPGLYFSAFLILKPLSFLLGQELVTICTTKFLRSVNVLFSVGNLVLFWFLLKYLRTPVEEKSRSAGSSGDNKRSSLHSSDASLTSKQDQCTNAETRRGLDSDVSGTVVESLTLAHFPVLFFISHLYYTDAGSLFFVLAMHLLAVQGKHCGASLLGVVAVIFRQTNVIWVLFVAGLAVLQFLENRVNINQCGLIKIIPTAFRVVLDDFLAFLFLVIPYLLVFILFAAFLIINKGIVVGDRSSHVAVFNVPQVFYFLGFTLAFSSPLQLDLKCLCAFLSFCKAALKRPLSLLFLAVACTLAIAAIAKFTYVHPYLLADNRHYPFYIWAKVYEKHWTFRYLLIPVYLYGTWTVGHFLANKGRWFIVIYSLCVFLVLIPQQLLEFRYFITPYLLFRLHMPKLPNLYILCELFLYISINAFTFYMFLFCPFYWKHENSLQRFMW